MSARTMRAARFHGADQPLRIEDVPYPEPGPDDVVVRLAACGICASDLHFLESLRQRGLAVAAAVGGFGFTLLLPIPWARLSPTTSRTRPQRPASRPPKKGMM